MIWFKTPDGEMVSTNSLPITEAKYAIAIEADEGMVVRFFQGDGETMTHVISIWLRHDDLSGFVAQVKRCAETLGVKWEDARVREIPESPTSPIQ